MNVCTHQNWERDESDTNRQRRRIHQQKPREISRAPYTSQQNDVAKRENSTKKQSARSMILGRALQLELWPETVNCAVYIQNWVKSWTFSKIPYEWIEMKESQRLIPQCFWLESVRPHPQREEKQTRPKESCFTTGELWTTLIEYAETY